jgi:hypothetical protein
MRTTRWIFVASITAVLSLLPTPTRAGGGMWTFPGQDPNTEGVLVVGRVAHARALLGLEAVEKFGDQDIFWAGPKQGPFFGYLSPRSERPAQWGPFPPPLPKDALLVGEVAFSETEDPGTLEVNLDFVVPAVQPGLYTLHHCNDPCTRQIGDTMSTPVIVVVDEGEAFAATRLSRIDRKIEKHRANSAARTARLERWVERLSGRIQTLEVGIDALETRPARDEGSTRTGSLAWPAAALLTGAFVLALARRRRSTL